VCYRSKRHDLMITNNDEDDAVTTLVMTAHQDRLGIVLKTGLTTRANTRLAGKLTKERMNEDQ
jgi:hypothetical protein